MKFLSQLITTIMLSLCLSCISKNQNIYTPSLHGDALQSVFLLTIAETDDEGITYNGLGGGTGVAVSENQILTNAHICQYMHNTHYVIMWTDSSVAFPANLNARRALSVDKVDYESDLCLLVSAEPNVKFSPVKLKRQNIKIPEKVIMIGAQKEIFPYVQDAYISGYVSKYTKLTESSDGNYYMISAPSSLGSSGSPVFNKKGELISILFSIYGAGTDHSFVGIGINNETIYNFLDSE